MRFQRQREATLKFMDIGLYDLLALAHVLFFVYWLGADLGVFYAARFSSNPRLSLETRLVIADIMAFVDLFPRLSVPLIGATGASMAIVSGDFHLNDRAAVGIWLVALIWVAITLIIYSNRKKTVNLKPMLTFDLVWRILVLISVALVGVLSLYGVGLTENRSLSVKLLIYAGAILLSLMLRWTFKPYRPALKRIIEGQDNEKNSIIMNKALSAAKPVILGLWFLTAAAAAVGLWQPF